MKTLNVPARTHGRVLVREAPAPRGALVGFHGYLETAEIQLARLESIPGAEHWTLISVQALNRFYRGRSQETVAGWMTRQDRELAINDNIDYVNRAMSELRTPPGPLLFVGFSQGAAMAFRAAVRGNRPAAGVIAVGGDVPPELLSDRSLSFPPTHLMRGENDDWYTAAKLQADVAALRGRGVAVDTLVFPGAHEWTPQVSSAIGGLLATTAS